MSFPNKGALSFFGISTLQLIIKSLFSGRFSAPINSNPANF